MKDTIKYALLRPFSYAHQGETVEAQFIELKEPSSHNLSEIGALRQGVVQAIRAYESTRQEDQSSKKAREEAPEPDADKAEEDSGISASDVITILAASPVNLASIYGSARQLILSKGIARVDGQEKMTLTIFEKMSARDVEMMIGTYISTFILAS